MDRPNVVWITLDSVRADHTTLGGYHRNTTPTLADMGQAGAGFDTCITYGKDTLPSSCAILTGQAPTRTTVGISGDILPSGIRTIPERFAEAGYRTALLSGNSFVGEETGLARGFERHQWLSSSTLHQIGVRTLLRYLLNIRRHSAGLTPDAAKHASPFLMNEIAKRWIGEFRGAERPFFYYLHYNEPHRPYYPPRRFRDRFTDDIAMSPGDAAETALRIHRNLSEVIAEGTRLSDEEWEAMEAMYDAEIAYTDHMIGQLVAWLESQDLEETVVVVTADHGEQFGEYGLLSHKFVLHDCLTRVPLAMRTVGGDCDLDSADLLVEADDLVQHSDVMRTLLELAEADTDDMLGVDLREEGRSFAVSQRGPPNLAQITEHNPDWDTSRFQQGVLTAIRTEEWKYLKADDGTELVSLEDELTDVSAEHTDLVDDLAATCVDWLAAHGQPVADAQEADFSDATRQQLRELGYID